MNQKLCKQLVRDGGFNDSSLQSVTRVAGRAALHDFEVLMDRYVNLEKADVAVISAVQIHGQYQDFGKAEEVRPAGEGREKRATHMCREAAIRRKSCSLTRRFAPRS